MVSDILNAIIKPYWSDVSDLTHDKKTQQGNAESRLEDALILFLCSVYQIQKYYLVISTSPIIESVGKL